MLNTIAQEAMRVIKMNHIESTYSTVNANYKHDDTWSNWHYLFGCYMTDIDQIVMYDGAIITNLTSEFVYTSINKTKSVAIIDHKCGKGKTDRNDIWPAMQHQIDLAEQLNVPFFMSIDFMYDDDAPCSFIVAKNDSAKEFLTKIKAPITIAGNYSGVWLSPYHWCWFLHKLRGKSLDKKLLIDRKGRHIKSPVLSPIITRHKLTTFESLPRKIKNHFEK